MGNEDVLASAVRRPRAFENACWLCFLGVIGGFCVPDGASSKQGTKKKKDIPRFLCFFCYLKAVLSSEKFAIKFLRPRQPKIRKKKEAETASRVTHLVDGSDARI